MATVPAKGGEAFERGRLSLGLHHGCRPSAPGRVTDRGHRPPSTRFRLTAPRARPPRGPL